MPIQSIHHAERHFNPHSHEGSDGAALAAGAVASAISIHTPTKGVTPWLNAIALEHNVFQSTLPRRE